MGWPGEITPAQRVLHPVVEQDPVGEAGEPVVERLVLELRDQRLQAAAISA